MLPFYLGIGLVLIVGLTFGLIYMLNSPDNIEAAYVPRPVVNAPMGKTDEGYWYKGDPNAPVKVEEYSDYECPACANLESRLFAEQFDKNYVETGKVQFIYREFPLTSIHTQAAYTAEVARCAGDQDKYWQVHDALFATQDQWDRRNPSAKSIILSAVEKAGADPDAVQACVDKGTYSDAINAAGALAIQKGLQGTPTVFVNGVEVVDTSSAGVRAAVDAALKNAAPESSQN